MKRFNFKLFLFICIVVSVISSCNKSKDFESGKLDKDQLSVYLAADSNFTNLLLTFSLERNEITKIFEKVGVAKNAKEITNEQIHLLVTKFLENKTLNKMHNSRKALLDKYPSLKGLSKEDFIKVYKQASKAIIKNIKGEILKPNSLMLLKDNMVQYNATDSINMAIAECIHGCEVVFQTQNDEYEMSFNAEILWDADQQYSNCVMACSSSTCEYNCWTHYLEKLHEISDRYNVIFSKLAADKVACENKCYEIH